MSYIQPPTIPTCATHYHACPKCYEFRGCGNSCTTDLGIGEYRGLPVGNHEVCADCVVPEVFVASEPERDVAATVGLVWYSLHLLDALLRIAAASKKVRAEYVAEIERWRREGIRADEWGSTHWRAVCAQREEGARKELAAFDALPRREGAGR